MVFGTSGGRMIRMISQITDSTATPDTAATIGSTGNVVRQLVWIVVNVTFYLTDMAQAETFWCVSLLGNRRFEILACIQS